MIKNFKYLLLLSVACLVLFNSCKDKDPDDGLIIDELITTLNYTLTSTSGDVVSFSFSDPDGDGGDAPIITGGTLKANTTYTGEIELKNVSASPPEDITPEILAEAEEHQFFFSKSNDLNVALSYGDQDINGNPLGLNSFAITSDASSGTITIILRHQPAKNASGVSAGDITNAGGDTDIEVTFDVTIQ